MDKKTISPVVLSFLAVLVFIVFLLVSFVLFAVTHDSSPSSESDYTVNVSQVDNAAFPAITVYADIEDTLTGERLESVSTETFKVIEVGDDGHEYEATIEEIAPLGVGDAMFLNLVLDRSASMNDSYRMTNAKSAANAFVDRMLNDTGTEAEITAFEDYVSTPQPFTSNSTLLHSAINDMYPDGDTALNDALYHAVQRTNKKSGSRVVIAFTDGEENSSVHSVQDVKDIARQTGIPVYIIGLGDSYDESYLRDLAQGCNGQYYSASNSNLTQALSDIYSQVYDSQKNMYRIRIRSNFSGNTGSFRTVRIVDADDETTQITHFEYVPVDNVPEYDTTSRSEDYVLPDSQTRVYSPSELERLSLWELYLARNEIFARHGRKFKHTDLMEYFMQKSWYHPIYEPDEFNVPLSSVETENVELMLRIEQSRNSPYLED